MNFSLLLSRFDEETLQKLVGLPAVRLLRKMDPKLTSQARLRDLVLEIYSPEGLLLTPASRKLLWPLLRPEWAEGLVLALALPCTGDPYDTLAKATFPRGSSREEGLFQFFDLTAPPLDSTALPPETAGLPASYPLFAHQRRAARRIERLLANDARRVLLHMPTGAGKTRTAMHIVANHLRHNEPGLVVWLAFSEELCEQAATEFTGAWSVLGDREVRLHRFWGNRKLDPSGAQDGLVVAGLAKTYSAARSDLRFITRLSERCTLVVIDEAHQAVAETYALVLDTLVEQRPTTSLLGLSATPGRTWSDIVADRTLADFFRRQKVSLEVEGYSNPVDYLVAEGYLARATYRTLPYRPGIQLTDQQLARIATELELPDSVLQRLEADEQRNLGIITAIEDLAKRHDRILVFAISVEHSLLLASVLHARGMKATSLTGNTPKAVRAQLIDDFKRGGGGVRVLCNYGVLTTGFDAPRTSAAVIARPTLSLVLFSQMVGRAIRGPLAGGNREAEIVTVVDADLPGFGSQSEAFNNWEDVWE